MIILEEHAVIYREIGDTFFHEYLSFIRKNYRTINAVIRCLKKLGKSTVLGIVFA